jgi:hypothetical protein
MALKALAAAVAVDHWEVLVTAFHTGNMRSVGRLEVEVGRCDTGSTRLVYLLEQLVVLDDQQRGGGISGIEMCCIVPAMSAVFGSAHIEPAET